MKPNQYRHRIALSVLLLVAPLFAQTTWGNTIVSRTATPLGGGIFQYDFSISNSGPDDVVLLTFTDAPVSDPLIAPSLTTPSGFLASYDSGLGLVDFLADSDLFAAGTTKGLFSLQSSADPSTNFKAFEALSTMGDIEHGTINGVPDAGSTLLMASLGLMALALARKTFPTVNPQP